MTDSSTAEVRDKGPLLLLSQRFAAWLAAADVCLALTTYQAGRLFFIGRKDDGGVRAHERIIEQCQGLWTDGQTLWTSALYMLWRDLLLASSRSKMIHTGPEALEFTERRTSDKGRSVTVT
jgi:hypothetical protein